MIDYNYRRQTNAMAATPWLDACTCTYIYLCIIIVHVHAYVQYI